ncbi:MAG TPA: hypothetical protein VLT90_13045 [Terriglobales bacterium]|nr:hypothetical protein [Terriglobales bacterium]
MDLKAYTFTKDGVHVTIVYGMQKNPVYRNLSDYTVSLNGIVVFRSTDWRATVLQLADVRQETIQAGYTEIV